MLFGLSCGSKGLDETLGLIFEVILLLVLVDDFARGGVDVRETAKISNARSSTAKISIFTLALSVILRSGFGVLPKRVSSTRC
jgi:hypothetical protein